MKNKKIEDWQIALIIGTVFCFFCLLGLLDQQNNQNVNEESNVSIEDNEDYILIGNSLEELTSAVNSSIKEDILPTKEEPIIEDAIVKTTYSKTTFGFSKFYVVIEKDNKNFNIPVDIPIYNVGDTIQVEQYELFGHVEYRIVE